MTKLLWLVFPVSTLASGCAAAGYSMSQGPAGYPARPAVHSQLPRFQTWPLPIGRWDNVMMLPPGSTVQVLMADGDGVTGAVLGAAISSLRVRVASGDVDLPAADVLRVDLLKGPREGAVRDGAKGAASGVGVVALVGLVLRRMPPPQWLAAGAIVGANQGVQIGRMGLDRVTVYLSPAVAPGARPRVQ